MQLCRHINSLPEQSRLVQMLLQTIVQNGIKVEQLTPMVGVVACELVSIFSKPSLGVSVLSVDYFEDLLRPLNAGQAWCFG